MKFWISKIIFSLSILFLPTVSQAQLFEEINTFLIKHVNKGRVDYSVLKTDSTDLTNLINQIAVHNLKDKSSDYKLAFYINSYNLLVINQIKRYYPVTSPMDIEGFFQKNEHMVGGEKLTLDKLEFDKLTNEYKDPRIHFALGCAAISCPFLSDNAYTPKHVQEQLEFRAQLIIDRPNYVEVDEVKKVAYLNKIFDWYKDQFSFKAGSLINFINLYRFYKVPADYEVAFFEYDWTLNDQNQ